MDAEYFKDRRLWIELATNVLWWLIFGAVAGGLIGGGRGFYAHAVRGYQENADRPVWALIAAAFAGFYGLAVEMPWGLGIGASLGLVLGIIRGVYHYRHG